MRKTHSGASQPIRNRRSPIFVDAVDERLFFTRYWNSQRPRIGAISESAALLRRSRQYLSASRFTEEVIFDPSGYTEGLASWMAHLCLTPHGSFGIQRASPSSANFSTRHPVPIAPSSSPTTAISTTIIIG